MNTESREHISCLMDGEISRETGRFLVRRLGANAELSATWARYHLVRDCLRHQDGGVANAALAARVRSTIEGEPLPKAHRWKAAGWLRPVAGMAIAASVALVAIMVVGPESPSVQPAEATFVKGSQVQSFVSPQSLTPAPVSQTASLLGASASDSRMNAYLLRHYQAAGSTGGKGFVTFVPIVIQPAAMVGEATDPEAVSARGPDGEESAEAR